MATSRMNNFKRMAERFALGEKLLTTKDKLVVMATQLPPCDDYRAAVSATADFVRVRLVKPGLKIQ